MTQYRTLTVKASEIAQAVSRAQSISDDWQAVNLEILRIPKVARRWRAFNPQFPYPEIVRYAGKPHKGYTREMNLAADWTTIAGYGFRYAKPETMDGHFYGWNSKAWDPQRCGYSHSPTTTWDGVRRETYHDFVDGLRYLYLAAIGEIQLNDRVYAWLRPYSIAFVNDLPEAVKVAAD